MISGERVAELLAIAGEATPGPWVTRGTAAVRSNSGKVASCAECAEPPARRAQAIANAAHIAAMSPDVIPKLVAYIPEEVRKMLDALEEWESDKAAWELHWTHEELAAWWRDNR